MKLILVGPRASGKTTMAHIIASGMGREVLRMSVRETLTWVQGRPDQKYLLVWDVDSLSDDDLAAIERCGNDLIVTVVKDSPLLDNLPEGVWAFRLLGLKERRIRQQEQRVFV